VSRQKVKESKCGDREELGGERCCGDMGRSENYDPIRKKTAKVLGAISNDRPGINWKFEYGGASKNCELLTPRSGPR
jgi:hypothetical protein